MQELSLQNIDQISRDISKAEITFSHLLDELIDHVCCDVENEMQNGLTFSEAYKKVKQKMGRRRLQEIQEETLYAVDTKYRNMKNTMKISGIIGTILFGVAALFKIQHWPGASIGMTLGGLVLVLVFLPSALGVLWKETHNKKRIFLFVSAFIVGACFITGTLFKVQHWPGAGLVLSVSVLIGLLFFIPALVVVLIQDVENKSIRLTLMLALLGSVLYVVGLLFKIQHWPLAALILILGVITLGFIVLPLFTWLKWKDENHISPLFLFIIIGALVLAVPGALVNLGLQRGFETGFYPNMEKQHAMYNYLYKGSDELVKQYHDSATFLKMEEIHSRTHELIAYISEIEGRMVQESEGKPGNPAISAEILKQTPTGLDIQYKWLSNPFHPDPFRDFLLGKKDTKEPLEVIVKDYQKYLSGITEDTDLKRIISSLDASKFLPDNPAPDGYYSMLPGLHALDLLKNSILAVELCTLKSVAGNRQTN